MSPANCTFPSAYKQLGRCPNLSLSSEQLFVQGDGAVFSYSGWINCVAAELLSAAASVYAVFAIVFLTKVEIFRCGVHELLLNLFLVC